ncbi:MAG: stage II sporulation protein D [Syntrophomonas sp.]|uniref:stage II sporulation protein D n=1 Tax=Syntrophomonas sp. TaxID=2053627 RepID=UPI0026319D0C|nr:stage II sporulation protein D [Syntrophomonas sp.]MDD2509546.1 stage II sporulation protein D [Syntrophomonas sp.]MDD3878417.1 stage II sporulation protein D [Syntrophomonas sp.]MDD4625484.1 stage II sporulation protein D [Syntrophomonas sp.]
MSRKTKNKLIIIAGIFFLGFITCMLIRACKQSEQISEPSISLYLSQEKRCIELKLEEYIQGVVAAEMPASFELEALKAQAVAARTYTLRKLIDGRKYALNSDLSDNIYECQAYISWEEFGHRHPQAKQLWQKRIEQACNETRGEIMLYNGEPIDALYHSTCGGKTESALESWGKDTPYLRSVNCGYCQHAKHYESIQVFSIREFQQLTGVSSAEKVKIIKKTPAGRSKKLQLNDRLISAEEFRRLCHLPSTWWSFKKKEDKFLIESKGYGHGLGMCQYGANGMAAQGKNYHDILDKYYQNIDYYRMNY